MKVSCRPVRLTGRMVLVMNETAGVGLHRAEKVVSRREREREREKDQPTDDERRNQAEPGIGPFKLSQNRRLSQQKLSSLSLPETKIYHVKRFLSTDRMHL